MQYVWLYSSNVCVCVCAYGTIRICTFPTTTACERQDNGTSGRWMYIERMMCLLCLHNKNEESSKTEPNALAHIHEKFVDFFVVIWLLAVIGASERQRNKWNRNESDIPAHFFHSHTLTMQLCPRCVPPYTAIPVPSPGYFIWDGQTIF